MTKVLGMRNYKTTISGVLAAALLALASSDDLNKSQKEVVGILATVAGSVFAYYSKDKDNV